MQQINHLNLGDDGSERCSTNSKSNLKLQQQSYVHVITVINIYL